VAVPHGSQQLGGAQQLPEVKNKRGENRIETDETSQTGWGNKE